MANRKRELTDSFELVAPLLASIRRGSGMSAESMYRKLAQGLGTAPGSVKRNWLRWTAPATEGGIEEGRGSLPSIPSLLRLIAAVPSDWLSQGEWDQHSELLIRLRRREDLRRLADVKAAKKRLDTLRTLVRAIIQMRGDTAFDETTWFTAIYDVVSEEVTRELRGRLLSTDNDSQAESRLAEDLLSGAVSKVVDRVLAAATLNLSAFAAEVHSQESQAVAEFLTDVDATLPSGDALGALLRAP